jgi:hypothetical protein
MVSGNHEYYQVLRHGTTLEAVDNIIRQVAEDSGVHFLQKSSWTLPETNLVFVGCTLWSDVDPDVFEMLNDSRHVFWNSSVQRGLHLQHAEFIQDFLNGMDPQSTTIVVTHHLPSYCVLHQRFTKTPQVAETNSGYASHLDHLLLNKPGLTAWMAGHTHESIHKSVHGVPVIVNPLGYPVEPDRVTAFSLSVALSVECRSGNPVLLPAANLKIEGPGKTSGLLRAMQHI